MSHAPLPLAVTMGDPAGIGPDIVLRSFAERATHALPDFIVIGSASVFRDRAARLGLQQPLHITDLGAKAPWPSDNLAIWDTGELGTVTPGQSEIRFASAIINSIDRAVDAVCNGRAAGIVTNPIAKATLTAAGFKHPGHTEYLGELAARFQPGKPFAPVMMLAADELRVVPLTVHIPLSRVASMLSSALIETTVRTTVADLKRYFGMTEPRIAVAGLNPHAGENGTLGREEIDIIAPALTALRRNGINVSGPFSADTLFHAAARTRYDAAIAMYHDQALIPLKTLAFDRGVNITLGLPFVRTSPDHGTAFDIAGSGKANPASFIAALRAARRMVDHASKARG